ncbi:hypothetical protein NAL33_13400 [Xanthomonas oryzae pv. oryzae]|nr:hypothetical protein NAL33_13400 [Xanthomonas oryzae pv. oryzae]
MIAAKLWLTSKPASAVGSTVTQAMLPDTEIEQAFESYQQSRSDFY